MFRKLAGKISNLIKTGKLVSVDDSKRLRFGKIDTKGKKGQPVNVFSPYGIMHNPPDGSLAITFAIGGLDSNQVCIVDDPENRPLKNLAKSEFAAGNYKTGTYIYFKDDGSVEISSVSNDSKIVIENDKISIENSTVEIGNGTFRKLLLETVKDVYNGHTHTIPFVGVTLGPSIQITDADLTENTKAS